MDPVLQSICALMAATPERWLSLTDRLPADRLQRPAASGEWSAVECLAHLIDSERVCQFRIEAFRAGRDFPAFNPTTDGSPPGALPPVALAEEFARLRQESLAMLETLVPTDLRRSARHSELGTVTLGEMLHNWATHDLNHTIQAERALMQGYLHGCGPWREQYGEHDLHGV